MELTNTTGKLLGKGRDKQMKRIFLIAVVALAALFMTGCDLFVDRSATELAFDDVQLIDVEDLQKYESLQTLDIRNADVTTELYDQLHAALPNCTILWSVPVGESRIDNQVTQVVLPKISGAGVAAIVGGAPPRPLRVDDGTFTVYSSNFVDFSDPVTFVVTAEDGTTASYAARITKGRR